MNVASEKGCGKVKEEELGKIFKVMGINHPHTASSYGFLGEI